MSNKVESILLVEDDRAMNFIHEHLIRKSERCNNIITTYNGKEGIDYLESMSAEKMPALIFLDINMPVLNGWEFIEQFKDLSEDKRSKIKVYMVTTSSSSIDIQRAEEDPDIAGFITKPLKKEILEEIIDARLS